FNYMTKRNIIVRYVTPADADAIIEFRIRQFKTAREFEILYFLALSKQRGRILIAEIDSVIVSTMQIEIVKNLSDFKSIDGDVPDDIAFNAYPTLYLSKAATEKSLRNTGLNSLLRIVSLENALDHAEICSLSGTAYENAPRLHLLERLGYNIRIIKQADFNYSRTTGNMFFLCFFAC
ncbi:MAG: hypothetical protein ACHQIM_22595, partial [Sphingobacteriales bacterium]